MTTNKFFAAALVTSSLFATGLASAATTVTLNPQANNGGVGVISPTNAAFQATGMQSNLNTTLIIAGNTGTQSFSETGQITVTQFVNGANTVSSGVFSNYQIVGNLTVSGSGSWSGSQFTANASGLTLSVALQAVSSTNQVINLGVASLAPGFSLAYALALGPNGVANGASGAALTSLTSTLNFTPAAGTSGLGGFFQAPVPFNIALNVGSAGGNVGNTSYTVSNTGVVTFSNPGNQPGATPGTANITFENMVVPEPGALSLAGIALLGLALASKRKSKAGKEVVAA